jgi:hypothetical protein
MTGLAGWVADRHAVTAIDQSARLADDPVAVRVDLPHSGGVLDRLKSVGELDPGYERTQT